MEAETASKNKTAIVVVALVLILAGIYYFSTRKPKAEQTAQNFSDAVKAASQTTAPSVPTTVNPVKQVLPTATPLEKTNPFNKTYVNPFK